MAAPLRAAGIEVKIDPQSYPNGRFARLHDPEGNPIELWQPKVPDTKARLQSSSGLFLEFSRVAADAEVIELLPRLPTI
jgi:hypothetical protein